MARSNKNSHKIVVNEVEYRWKASSSIEFISVIIWPTSAVGASVICRFDLNESDGDELINTLQFWKQCEAIGDQPIVTNRFIRRVILHALKDHDYDPNLKAKQLNLNFLDKNIKLDDAVRGVRFN